MTAIRSVSGRAAAIAALAAASLLSGCAEMMTPKVQVIEPRTARPTYIVAPAVAEPAANGAIYHTGAFRPLFEDRRARLIGDVLTVSIQEKTSAKQSTASNIDRKGSIEASIGGLPFFNNASTLAKLGATGTSANTMAGKGDTASDNTFSGTITVTVIEVLANGNLVVSGEKQIGINQNVDTLRFSGVVNPATILAGNVVSSTQIADARLQVRGSGDIDRAQTTGWLSRFFLSWFPI
ncbi:MAG: flagellar basal body L-ring protein FlgH [Burkholderiaceae bacterium]